MIKGTSCQPAGNHGCSEANQLTHSFNLRDGEAWGSAEQEQSRAVRGPGPRLEAWPQNVTRTMLPGGT
jgi:hypothetical protein